MPLCLAELPVEILEEILEYATNVPGSFVYHLEEEVDTIAINALYFKVMESLSTKVALSQVSKYFHELSDRFLFRALATHTNEQTESLLAAVRQEDDTGKKRGRWCRQLILLQGNHGQAAIQSLRMLIAACPGLVELRCRLADPRRFGLWNLPADHLDPLVALRGSGLRYLHFGHAVMMPFNMATALLAHLPALEVCRIDRLIATSHDEIGGTAPGLSHRPVLSVTGITEAAKEHQPVVIAGHQRALEEMEPGTSLTSPPIVLCPELRVLDCDCFVQGIGEWQLPALKEVVAGMRGVGSYLENLQRALFPHSAGIINFTYTGPHLLNMWAIVKALPSLVVLRVDAEFADFHGVLRTPHLHLSKIAINSDYEEQNQILALMESVKENGLRGLLPALRDIVLRGVISDSWHGHSWSSFQWHGVHTTWEYTGGL